MIDFLKWIGIISLEIIALIIALIILALIWMCFPQNKYHYEFIDLDNNSGIAKECSYKFEDYKRGGQGSPVCELENGTVKQVKEYKYIYDSKYIPIKEILKKEVE